MNQHSKNAVGRKIIPARDPKQRGGSKRIMFFNDDDDDDDGDGGDDGWSWSAQNLGPHFVRACSVKPHVNISQEPLFTECTGKMPRPRS